jgi:predicted O-methyltransferase YrrM
MAPFVAARIRRFRNANGAQLLSFLNDRFLGIVRPLQVPSEILHLVALVERARPKVVVEIGTASGGVLCLLARAAPEDATIISVDIPEDRGGYPHWRQRLYRAFGRGRQSMYLVKGDSHMGSTLTRVKEILSGKAIDFLFVDGDHTYVGVRQDFNMYGPLVRKDGLVAFHDVAFHPYAGPACEVDRFWNEIKAAYEHEEFIENPKQGWAGIGVLTQK